MAEWESEERPRLPWDDIPAPVRAAAEAVVGARVIAATRVWGGFGWTPAYHLTLDDGRRAFFKGVPPTTTERMRESSEYMHQAYDREERVYRELDQVIAPWAPTFYGSLRCDDWHILLLEDLGPATVPPWPEDVARRVLHAYADFHRATIGATLPAWLPRPDEQLRRDGRLWEWALEPNDCSIDVVAGMARGQAREAHEWLEAFGAVLATTAAGLADPSLPRALLHNDTRSDNLRWVGDRLYLLDWPHVSVGPPEDDMSMFVQTISLESGVDVETLVSFYAERNPVKPEALDAAVAALAGFFAYLGWRPDVPGLPELRRFQRQQLRLTLPWAAKRLRLPPPEWVGSLDV